MNKAKNLTNIDSRECVHLADKPTSNVILLTLKKGKQELAQQKEIPFTPKNTKRSETRKKVKIQDNYYKKIQRKKTQKTDSHS